MKKINKSQNFHRWYDYQTQNNSQNENNSEDQKRILQIF